MIPLPWCAAFFPHVVLDRGVRPDTHMQDTVATDPESYARRPANGLLGPSTVISVGGAANERAIAALVAGCPLP
jgi:hypothetical protein